MSRLRHLLTLLGVNAIPIAGIYWDEWSDATAIAFYWCDTALILCFVVLRLVIHRRATNKRGHYVATKTSINGGPWKSGVTSYAVSFATTAGAFTVGNLVFLAVLLGLFGERVGGGAVDPAALRRGLVIALVALVIEFAFDLHGIQHRRFQWVRRMADAAMWRVFVIYLAIFIGVFFAVMLDVPHAMFTVFFGLRLFTDLASNFPQYDPQRPPRWMGALTKDRAALEEKWRKDWDGRREKQREDEEPFDGRASRPAPAV